MLATFVGGVFYQQQITVQPIQVLTPAQKAILDTLEVVYIDDCSGGPGYKTLRVKDANLQVVNGTGNTESANGLGNIIIGYNEVINLCARDGSHNIVLGFDNAYQSWSGFVSGSDNLINDPFDMCLSGFSNRAFGENNILIGGRDNLTTGVNNVIVAGDLHTISGDNSVILGGREHTITPAGDYDTITGGEGHTISGSFGSISGGDSHSIQPGSFHDWVAGSLFEDN